MKPRCTDERRFRRHMAKRTKRGTWCAICAESAENGLGLDWCDPRHPDRGTVLFLLCHLCAKTNYSEVLNEKHREVWTRGHTTPVEVSPPAPISLWLKESV